jgi:hypothetical protein
MLYTVTYSIAIPHCNISLHCAATNVILHGALLYRNIQNATLYSVHIHFLEISDYYTEA